MIPNRDQSTPKETAEDLQFQAIDAICAATNVRPADKLIGVVIARAFRLDRIGARLSQSAIAEAAGIDRISVTRGLKRLEEAGWILVIRGDPSTEEGHVKKLYAPKFHAPAAKRDR